MVGQMRWDGMEIKQERMGTGQDGIGQDQMRLNRMG